jgi:hypothetical protein
MGVWDLKGLHQEIKKWELLAQRQDISELDRSIYLKKAQAARQGYAYELADFEERSTKFEEASDGEVSS